VVQRLSISRSLIYELLAAEASAPGTGLRSVKVGARRLVPESALVEFIDRLESPRASTECPNLMPTGSKELPGQAPTAAYEVPR
jgi:hypothetical protein